MQLQLHYTNYITLQLQLPLHCTTRRYTTTTTFNYNSTTLQLQLHLQLQLQLHYTTLHPAVVVRWPLQPFQPLQKTQLQPPFGPSVDSLCHPWVTTTNPSYGLPIFETSATALCGTTGMIWCTETSTQIKNKIKYVQHEGKTCFGLLWHFGISIFSGSFSSLASPGTVDAILSSAVWTGYLAKKTKDERAAEQNGFPVTAT